jgi:diaminopimelate decarboxylase
MRDAAGPAPIRAPDHAPEAALITAARRFGTPLYLYDLDAVRARCRALDAAFDGRFGVSYAVKANPNAALLAALRRTVAGFDASSLAEVRRALAAGADPRVITFSGPAKRSAELIGAIEAGIGELVLESLAEAETASALAEARGRVQTVLLRINPIRLPRRFGASMSGKASQFGVDEEEMPAAVARIAALPGLDLAGFHIYSGTNCLIAEAIAENFAIFIDIFRRAAAALSEAGGRAPRKLVFGAGFGIPYLPDDTPLDLEALAGLVNPMLDALRAESAFRETRLGLEMGRWIVGPAGWLVTSVIAAKTSRGVAIRACDAGFNNHLAACGMMGAVIRRNWRFANLTNPDGSEAVCNLVGPLCTSIDLIASDLALPELRLGDLVAVAMSGAYGLTASPTRFISHPEPREVVLDGGSLRDVSESLLNHAAPDRAVPVPNGAPAKAEA